MFQAPKLRKLQKKKVLGGTCVQLPNWGNLRKKVLGGTCVQLPNWGNLRKKVLGGTCLKLLNWGNLREKVLGGTGLMLSNWGNFRKKVLGGTCLKLPNWGNLTRKMVRLYRKPACNHLFKSQSMGFINRQALPNQCAPVHNWLDIPTPTRATTTIEGDRDTLSTSI